MIAGGERSGTSPRQAGPLQVVLVNNSDEQAGTQGTFAVFRKPVHRTEPQPWYAAKQVLWMYAPTAKPVNKQGLLFTYSTQPSKHKCSAHTIMASIRLTMQAWAM